MANYKEKLLSLHRSQVFSGVFGLCTVVQAYIVYNIIDLCVLLYWWFINSRLIHMMNATGFTNELILNTIITVLPFISIFQGTVLFYVALISHSIKLWHICHMGGETVGLIIFNALKIKGDIQVRLAQHYFKVIQGNFMFAYITLLLRIFFVLLCIWFCLVMERLRSSGGDVNKKKCAERIEMDNFKDDECISII